MQQLYSLLVTPFVTGFTGYFTNYLAIKMLFRPHQRRWYSFGWQGVIPKNRGKLAKEVGLMVGRELLGENEIQGAIQSENFQLLLNNAVSKELKKFLSADYGSAYDIACKAGISVESMLLESLNNLLSNEKFIGKINKFLNNEVKSIANKFLSKSLNEIENIEGYVDNFINSILKSGNWQDIVIDEISSFLNNLVLSGKSLMEILPDGFETKIEKFSDMLTDNAIDHLEKILNEDSTKKTITKKLIDMKDNFFDNGLFDSIKLGFISMFLTEEVISGIVNNELPKLVTHIKEDEKIREKIKQSISKQINIFLNKPLYSLAGVIGIDTVFEIRSNAISNVKKYLKSDVFSEKIKKIILNFIEKYSNFTLHGILNTLGIKSEKFLNNIIDVRKILSKDNNHKLLTEAGINVLKNIQINNLYEKIPENSFENIKSNFVRNINIILNKHISTVLNTIDLPMIVESKINNLNLYEVEDLLFSFMKDQFKWINILGFVLGFLFGVIQSIFFYFLNT